MIKEPTQLDLDGSSNTADLQSLAVRGGTISLGVFVAGRVLGLLIVAILARLLTPEDYGLIGMVLAFTTFLSVFSDFGLTMAMVQKSDLTQSQISTLFWANLGFGLFLTCLTAAASPLFVMFYKQPELMGVNLWLSLGFVIGAAGTQHKALLIRRMQFGLLGFVELIGLLGGGAVGILMAMRGYGVYSLVGQSIATQAASTVSSWLMAYWIPGLPSLKSGVSGMLKFGGYLTSFNIVNYFSRNLDRVLIGRVWGAAELGLYTRTYALMLYPTNVFSNPLSRVIISALSKLQNDRQKMAQAYINYFIIIAVITFPAMTALYGVADYVIEIIYGSRWVGVIPIFKILCLAGIGQAIFSISGIAFYVTGRTDRMFKCGLVASIVFVISFALGLKSGAKGVALAYTIGFGVVILPYLKYTFDTLDIKFGSVIYRMIFPFLLSLAIIPLIEALRFKVLVGWPMIPTVLICFGAGAIFYFGILFIAWRDYIMGLKNTLLNK